MARSSHGRQPGGWLAKESQREALAGYLFILPTFLGYTAFVIGPILAAIGLSFTKYDMLTPASFIGLANYTHLLSDPRLRTVYRNTFFFTVFAVTFNVGVGLLLAVLLNRRMPGPCATCSVRPISSRPWWRWSTARSSGSSCIRKTPASSTTTWAF